MTTSLLATQRSGWGREGIRPGGAPADLPVAGQGRPIPPAMLTSITTAMPDVAAPMVAEPRSPRSAPPQPFNPENVIVATNWRCANRKNRMSGSVATTFPAMIRLQSVW